MKIRSVLIFTMLALAACASHPTNYQRSTEQANADVSPKNAKSLPLWECVAEGEGLNGRKEYMLNAVSEENAVTATQAALVVNGRMSGFGDRMSPDVSCKQKQIVN